MRTRSWLGAEPLSALRGRRARHLRGVVAPPWSHSLPRVRKTVFLHVGAPAAGTAFLRRRLTANRETLRQAGIAVVDGRRDERVARSSAPTVVVIHPRLARASRHDASRMLRALTDHDARIVYAAPDAGTALIGEWQRHVIRRGRMVSLTAWIKELADGQHSSFWRAYDPREVFSTWAVPAGDFHVVTAPPGPRGANALWRRFGSVIGLPAAVLDTVPPRTRLLLGVEEIELLRRVYAGLSDRKARGARQIVGEAIARDLRAGRKRSRPTPLPADHRAWIERLVAGQREFLGANRFEIVGDLDDLQVDGRRFATCDVIPDEERMLPTAVETGAALVEQLVSTRARRGPLVTRLVSRGATRTLIPKIARRGRRLATRVGTSAGAVRRRRSRPDTGVERTYYLHIGAPKCGSTYLQTLIWRNRRELMKDGVYVAGRSSFDQFQAGTDFRGRPYVTQAPEGPWRGAWDRLITDAERSAYPKIVISSEFLADAAPEEISSRLGRLDGADIQVIYATRDVASLLGSVWQQLVKTHAVAPWHAWLDALAARGDTDWLWPYHDVGEVIERWTGTGADELHLLLLPRPDGAPDELWRRFRSIVGWSIPTDTNVPRGNESLGYSQAELLRRLQKRLVRVEPRTERAVVTKHVATDTLAEMERMDVLVIPERLRSWLDAASARQREQILASGARVVGDLEELRISDSSFSPHPAAPRTPVMLEAAVSVIAALGDAIARERAGSGW